MVGDKYTSNSYVYWFLWCFVVAYVVVTTVWIAIFINNASITYTWFKYPGAPGTQLTSLRNSFTSVTLRIAIVCHLFVPIFVMTLIGYRSNTVISLGTLVAVGIAFIMCLFSLIALGDMYSHCNGQNQYGNLCNDPKWCCVHEILTNRANGCPNTVDCAPPLNFDDVHPNQTFLGLFWMDFTLVILQAVYLGVMIVIWRWPDAPEMELPMTQEEAPQEEEEEEPEPAAAPIKSTFIESLAPITATRKRRTHGLRKN